MPVNGIRILAHRGARITSPENTVEAFVRARAEGADCVELDIQLSADGEPFIFHDDDAARVTGQRAKIAELPWREIAKLKVFGRHPVPHLDDILQVHAAWPQGELWLDLHQDSPALAEAVARRLAAYSERKRVAVLDFYSRRRLLFRVRNLVPDLPLAVMPGSPWNILRSVRELNPVEISLGWDGPFTRWLYRLGCRLYDVRTEIRFAKEAGVRVSGGIANTPEDMRYFLNQGTDGIWTDDLALAQRVLEKLPPKS